MRVALEMIAAGSGLEEGQGGAAGYFNGLIPALCEDPRVTRLIVYVARWYGQAATWRHPKLVVRRCPVPKGRPQRVAYEQIVVPIHAALDRADILFSTGNYRPLLYRRPNVVCLHAVQHFLFGGDIGRARAAYLQFAVPRSVRTADLTIAVTETLRQDAIRLFDLDPDRIVAAPMGPSPWVAEMLEAGTSPEPYRIPGGAPYLLCISRLYAHKNHRRLLEAFAQVIADDGFPHQLLIVGGDADISADQLAEWSRGLGIADRVQIMGRVRQDRVPGLYAGAAAVAYPSLYETFGHPLLEAFAIGCPLVTSSTGATAEVAGDAARLVDPTDVDDIAAGIRDVLGEDTLRARLVAAGNARVREFSWERCARDTVDALHRALVYRGES